jgi:polynucleotide 5'-kinase involved in rRNA processing
MTEEVDIWKESQQEEFSTAKTDRTIIIMGEQDSGKSTLAAYLSGNKASEKKQSYIIDYTFGRTQSATGPKQILHIYEIGESTNTQQIIESIASKFTTNFTVIITANLSNPGRAYTKLISLLDSLTETIKTYEKTYSNYIESALY